MALSEEVKEVLQSLPQLPDGHPHAGRLGQLKTDLRGMEGVEARRQKNYCLRSWTG